MDDGTKGNHIKRGERRRVTFINTSSFVLSLLQTAKALQAPMLFEVTLG
jgi:hypothetical protein